MRTQLEKNLTNDIDLRYIPHKLIDVSVLSKQSIVEYVVTISLIRRTYRIYYSLDVTQDPIEFFLTVFIKVYVQNLLKGTSVYADFIVKEDLPNKITDFTYIKNKVAPALTENLHKLQYNRPSSIVTETTQDVLVYVRALKTTTAVIAGKLFDLKETSVYQLPLYAAERLVQKSVVDVI